MASKTKSKEPVSQEPKLRPHQERGLAKLEASGGVVLNHSTGSGKTLTFLTAIQRYQDEEKDGKSLIVAPASLVTNIDKEIAKHGLNIDRKRLVAVSYEKAVNMQEELKAQKFHTVVFDEAQKLRNTNTKRHAALSEVVEGADRRVLATATSAYNKISDIAPLYNIAAGKEVLPTDPKKFDNKYLDKVLEKPPLMKRIFGAHPKEITKLKNKEDLKKRIQDYADYYDLADDPDAANHFPSKTEHHIEVEMSPEQHRMYKYMEDKLPFYLKMKVRMNMPLDKKESAQLNAFSSGIRQVSNSIKPFLPNMDKITPKIDLATQRLAEKMKGDKNFRGVVYSNYLEAGLSDYSKRLGELGINHSVYTGGLSSKEKDAMVEAYNSGKTPVLLISSSGAEGLNLKGTKLTQVLEPHFNHSKIKQVIGRGVRFNSHEHLPEKERHVDIELYHSVFPSGVLGKSKTHSIDQYLLHNSVNKGELNKELDSLLKEDTLDKKKTKSKITK